MKDMLMEKGAMSLRKVHLNFLGVALIKIYILNARFVHKMALCYNNLPSCSSAGEGLT